MNQRIATAAEEYHVGSRNLGAFKGVNKAYQVHFDPHVMQLAAEAPLHQPPECRRVILPADRVLVTTSLEEVVTQRTSGRSFGMAPLAAEQLASLLCLGNGVRQVQTQGPLPFYQRNVPNSGNLGSVEIYPIVMNVSDIDPGIYHFDTVEHNLARLRSGQYREWLRERILFQVEFAEAACALVLVVAFARLQAKYGQRGYRLGILDAGHVSENIYLAGFGMDLQVCATAGFIDDELDAALGLDGLDMATILVLLVGSSAEPFTR